MIATRLTLSQITMTGILKDYASYKILDLALHFPKNWRKQKYSFFFEVNI
jgi:hypothetical protein